MKLSFHVKTNLNYDGRVLASIDGLANAYPEAHIMLSILPDAPTKVSLPENVELQEIKLPLRRFPLKALLRPLIVLHYLVTDFIGLWRFSPDVIHVHDLSAAFAPCLYKRLWNRQVKLVYDDHEIFNRPNTLIARLMYGFEKKVSRQADVVVVANKERGRIVKKLFGLKCFPEVVENHFYDRRKVQPVEIDEDTTLQLQKIKDVKAKGKRIILHQGRLFEQRGLDILEELAEHLPGNWKLLVIGERNSIFEQTQLISNQRVFSIGKVRFDHLPLVYELVDAAIVFYRGAKLNNRYCAPNRLYQSAANGLPLIVNEDNPVLRSFVKGLGTGVSLNLRDSEASVHLFFDYFNSFQKKAEITAINFSSDAIKLAYVALYQKLLR